MEDEMRSDAELLYDLTNKAPVVTDRVTGKAMTLSRAAISFWTGISIKTISDYCLGKYNIPVDFWRSILKHHFDPRIISMMLPTDGHFEVYFDSATKPNTTREFFRAALELQQKHNDQVTYILDILADGRVDELDETTLTKYCDAYHQHRHLDAQLFRAINESFTKSKAAIR